MMGQAGRPTSHYLLYPALPCATLQPCYVCLLVFNVEELMHKLLRQSSEP